MSVNPIDIPYPLEGLNRATGFTDQPLRTSRDLQNTQGVDQANQRIRGVPREGISNYFDTPAAAGNKIRRMDTLVRDERRVSYTNIGTAALVWGRMPKRATTYAGVVRVSVNGNIFSLSGISSATLGAAHWSKYNAYGIPMWWQRIDVPVPSATITSPQCQITGFWVDEFENVYASTGLFTESNGTVELTTPNTTDHWGLWDTAHPGRIWKWSPNALGTGYDLAWTLQLDDRYTCTDLIVRNGVLYTIQAKLGADDAGAPNTRTSRVVWYGDISGPNPPDPAQQQVLQPSNAAVTGAGVDAIVFRSLAIREADGLEFIVAGGLKYIDSFVNASTEKRFMVKINLYATVTASLVSTTATNKGGFGHGVAVDKNGDIISTGYADASGANKVWMKKNADNSVTWVEQWSEPDAGQTYHDMYTRFQVDAYNNTYLGAAGLAVGMRVYDKDGVLITSGGIYRVNSVAVPPAGILHTPNFREDDPKLAEFAYAAGDNGNPSGGTFVGVTWTAATKTLSLAGGFAGYTAEVDDYIQITAIPGGTTGFYAVVSATATTIVLATSPKTSDSIANVQLILGQRALTKYRLLTVASTAGSPRSFLCAAAAPPDIKLFTKTGGFIVPGGRLTGTGCLNASARYVSAAALLGRWFVSDGLNYIYVDPLQTTNYPNGRVERWEPTSAGVMPPRAKLVFAWRDRMGLALSPDDPHNIYLTAGNDPFNIDLAPVSPSITQAMVFNLTPAGLVPDLPRSFIPYTDDLLIILCDHSIWQVSGNPLRGGEIDRITGVIGGSFGRPWCVDPEGAIYFHGSRGGIFMMAPKGLPVRLSTESIDADLAEIDLASYFIEMAWDDRAQGLRVYQLPYGAGGTPVKHWLFERRTKAWIPQKYGSPASTVAQPTAICVFDGDGSSDRRILMAGEDQYVGFLDPLARADRSGATNGLAPIYSYVLIGPIVARNQSDRRSRISYVEITLASDRGGCGCEIFASDVPDITGESVWQGELDPGYNRVKVNARGRYLFLRLFNAIAGRSWAFESAVAFVADAGRVS